MPNKYSSGVKEIDYQYARKAGSRAAIMGYMFEYEDVCRTKDLYDRIDYADPTITVQTRNLEQRQFIDSITSNNNSNYGNKHHFLTNYGSLVAKKLVNSDDFELEKHLKV